jgi:hypothetical protein
MERTGKTALLVAEREGDWSAWVEPLREQSDDVAVILQRRGESPAELAARVRARVEELQGAGADIVAATLVGGVSFDNKTLAARANIIRAIVGPMAMAGGHLYLDGNASAGRGRHAMQALASALEGQIGHSVVVSTNDTGSIRRAA